MRHLLVLFLCLLMPLQGVAASQLTSAPCPMQDMVAMQGAGDTQPEALAQAMEDCCNDLATFERTGQACKSAQTCFVPAAAMAFLSVLVTLDRLTLDPGSPVWRSLPPGARARLWRPPTSV